jgi:hypothetical protein
VTLLLEAVGLLTEAVRGSGCEDGTVTLRRDPDAPRCQYERGASLVASFGGRTAQVVTGSPVQTSTRPSSLAGMDLPTPEHRTAALGIMNAVAGFLCLARRLHACDPACHGPCLEELREEIGGRRIFTPVHVPALSQGLASPISGNASDAEMMMITAEALIQETDPGTWREQAGNRGMLLLGPSTSGVASLLSLPHWCPYGR